MVHFSINTYRNCFTGINKFHFLCSFPPFGANLPFLQHLEVIVWCSRHQFLEYMPSRHSTISSWRSAFNERKSAAMRRCWPEFMCNDDEAAQPGSTLFIEDALTNLVTEQEYEGSGELEVACLLKDSSPSLSIEEASRIYPFKNMRSAVDMLFLRGSSDLLVAKQSIVSSKLLIPKFSLKLTFGSLM